MVDATGALEAPERQSPPRLQSFSPHDISEALRKGFLDFRTNRSDLVFLAIIYPIVALFAARLAFGYDVLPLVFPILGGMTLVGPLMTLAYDNASRRQDRRGAAEPLREHPARGAVLAFAGLLTAIFFVWLCVAWLLYALTMGVETPASVGAFVDDLFGTAGGWTLIVVGNLVGFAFAAVVLSIGIVTFPLILDRGMGAGEAMRVSARVTAENPAAVAAWGLVVAAAFLLGSIPAFIGLAVAVPVLGHASWHLYRKIVPT